MAKVPGRDEFRIAQISLERGHMHLVIEAESTEAMGKGMQAFLVSAAKWLNATVEREGERRIGKVFPARYHAAVIGSPTQARNVLRYCLSNWLHQGRHDGVDEQFWTVDWYWSAPTFRGWKEGLVSIPKGYDPLPVREPRGWLLREGWKQAGSISWRETPGPRRRGS